MAVTTVLSLEDGDHFYKQISLELSRDWQGEVYLRFEPFMGPAFMARVLPGDVVALSLLAEGAHIVAVDPISDDEADDDFQPGDSG